MICDPAICPLWLWSTFYSTAIDLVHIAYLDSMTMTSFNIFKARVVIFKKLKVNAKMQIEHGCWLWVVLLVIFIVFLYYRSLDAKSWWQNHRFRKNWYPKFEQFDWLWLILKLISLSPNQNDYLEISLLPNHSALYWSRFYPH